MFRRQYIHSVQIGTYACPDIQNEPTKLVVTFQLVIILLPVQFSPNRFQTGSDYLRNLRTENRTEQRTERTRTEQNRTFGSVLSVLVLWISSELNFGNTIYTYGFKFSMRIQWSYFHCNRVKIDNTIP